MATDKKPFDLEKRTFQFAVVVRAFVRKLPKTLANIQDARQLVDASGSVGANYIEAVEALSKKDFLLHVKISRKEAKESAFWLRLLYVGDSRELDRERDGLVQEATELTSIFGSMIRKNS